MGTFVSEIVHHDINKLELRLLGHLVDASALSYCEMIDPISHLAFAVQRSTLVAKRPDVKDRNVNNV